MEAHLDKRSFSNTDDISHLLDSVGVPIDVVRKLYPSLSALMVRRHEIVHKGDLRATDNEQRERTPEPIDASKVKEWNETALSFITAVAAYKLEAGV